MTSCSIDLWVRKKTVFDFEKGSNVLLIWESFWTAVKSAFWKQSFRKWIIFAVVNRSMHVVIEKIFFFCPKRQTQMAVMCWHRPLIRNGCSDQVWKQTPLKKTLDSPHLVRHHSGWETIIYLWCPQPRSSVSQPLATKELSRSLSVGEC